MHINDEKYLYTFLSDNSLKPDLHNYIGDSKEKEKIFPPFCAI